MAVPNPIAIKGVFNATPYTSQDGTHGSVVVLGRTNTKPMFMVIAILQEEIQGAADPLPTIDGSSTGVEYLGTIQGSGGTTHPGISLYIGPQPSGTASLLVEWSTVGVHDTFIMASTILEADPINPVRAAVGTYSGSGSGGTAIIVPATNDGANDSAFSVYSADGKTPSTTPSTTYVVAPTDVHPGVDSDTGGIVLKSMFDTNSYTFEWGVNGPNHVAQFIVILQGLQPVSVPAAIVATGVGTVTAHPESAAVVHEAAASLLGTGAIVATSTELLYYDKGYVLARDDGKYAAADSVEAYVQALDITTRASTALPKAQNNTSSVEFPLVGYIAGGFDSGGAINYGDAVSYVQGMLYRTETAYEANAALVRRLEPPSAVESADVGYFLGGELLKTTAYLPSDNVESIERASESMYQRGIALAVKISGAGGASADNAGYLLGEASDTTTLVRKYEYSTDASSSLAVGWSAASFGTGGTQGPTKGFFSGGNDFFTDGLHSLLFSTETLSQQSNFMSDDLGRRATFTGRENAYWVGGYEVGGANEVSTIEAHTLVTASSVSVAAALITAKSGLMAVSALVSPAVRMRGVGTIGPIATRTPLETKYAQALLRGIAQITAADNGPRSHYATASLIGASVAQAAHAPVGWEVGYILGREDNGADAYPAEEGIEAYYPDLEVIVLCNGALSHEGGYEGPAAAFSGEVGYYAGGASLVTPNNIETFVFNTETVGSLSVDLPTLVFHTNGSQSGDSAYWTGGWLLNGLQERTDVMQGMYFSTEATRSITAVLPTPISRSSSASSSLAAYLSGGDTLASTIGTNKIDKLTFSTETVAATAMLMSNTVWGGAGTQQGSSGYFGLGASGGDEFLEIDFDTDTVILPYAGFTDAYSEGTAVSSKKVGAWMGGEPMSSFYNRIFTINLSTHALRYSVARMHNYRTNIAGMDYNPNKSIDLTGIGLMGLTAYAPFVEGQVAMLGVGALTMIGEKTLLAVLAALGIGVVSASGVIVVNTVNGQIAIVGNGSMLLTALRELNAGGVSVGTGTLTIQALMERLAALGALGDSLLTPAAVQEYSANAILNGVGITTADGEKSLQGDALVIGVGYISPAGSAEFTAKYAGIGASEAILAAMADRNAAAANVGTGQATPETQVELNAASLQAGVGAVVMPAEISRLASTVANGIGGVGATVVAERLAAAYAGGVGGAVVRSRVERETALSASGVGTMLVTAGLDGSFQYRSRLSNIVVRADLTCVEIEESSHQASIEEDITAVTQEPVVHNSRLESDAQEIYTAAKRIPYAK